MAFRLFKKLTTLKSTTNPHFHLRICSFSCRPTQLLLANNKGNNGPFVNNGIYNLSPLFPDGGKNDFEIELADSDTWHLSSGLAAAWRGNSSSSNNNNNNNVSVQRVSQRKSMLSEDDEEEERGTGLVNYVPPNKEDPDFDEIEDMRIRGCLFYKLDKNSKEYEEHKFDFHRRKSSNKKSDWNEENAKKRENVQFTLASEVEKGLNSKDEGKEIKKKEKFGSNLRSRVERLSLVDKKSVVISQLPGLEDYKKKENLNDGSQVENLSLVDKNSYLVSGFHGLDGYDGKKKRTPTFNQLTAPFHEPFCLDIYVSKGSVRASVIHRATSKVVAVAHSISKDLKFDLGSTKSRNACAMVGKVLAQRALDDDIHNVVYTPRKGDKLEGKLQIVLQAITEGGIDVKVKLKQRKTKKAGMLQTKAQEQL